MIKINFNRIIYWLTLVGPISELIIGFVNGVKGAIQINRADDKLMYERTEFESLVSAIGQKDAEVK